MKIAIFHELQYLSGARKVVEEYGKILKNNNEVDLYYVDDKRDKTIRNSFNNIYYFKFKGRDWVGKNWKNKLYKDSIELIKIYFLHKKIANLINSKGYDFIFINPSKFTQAPFILRFLSGKKVYYAQESLRIVYEDIFSISNELFILKKIYEELNRAIKKTIDKSNFKKANIVLVNSKFSKNKIDRIYNKKTLVCYLGVDTEKYINKLVKKEYDLIFVGQKDNIEGYNLLTQYLDLYGAVKPIVKFISRNDKGSGIAEGDLIKAYGKSKIALCLSVNEPFGLTAIEAMSCRVPVVAVEEGGFKESVLNNKTGYLIKRNPYDLKTKIDFLLQNNKARNEMGLSARKHVIEKFTWKKSVSRFIFIVNSNLMSYE